MIVNETTLANGLRVVTAKMIGSRSVAVNVAIGTGSRMEDYQVNGGVSHFLEHLLFKGTLNYPTPEVISEAVDEVGGYNNAYTAEDVTNFFIKVPARHSELALDILADMVKHPLIDQSELDRERDVVVEEMRMIKDDPARDVSSLFYDLLFPDNPLGKPIIGSEEVIRAIPRERIMDYLRAHYQPNNLVVAVAGRLEHEIVVAQVEELLGDLKAAELPQTPPVGHKLSDKLVTVEAKDTAQAHFVVAARGYAYEHPDAMGMRVVAAILGAGMSSRLFLEIRERRGLAYTVACDASSYIDAGVFEVYAGATVDKADQALQAVIEELQRLGVEPVGDKELRKAKEQLRASLELSLESNAAVADRLSRQLAIEGRLHTVEETIEQILAVTPDDVMRVAGDMLALDKLRCAIIAPDPQPVAELFEQLVTTKE